MRKVPSSIQRFGFALLILTLSQIIGLHSSATAGPAPQSHQAAAVPLRDVHVTKVQGPSWLHHLGRNMNESSMGQTGLWGPTPVQEEGAGAYKLNSALPEALPVTGADIFRYGCRACHGERGEGVPPEINSIIGPVQSTSAEFILARMKKSGAPISTTVANQLAAQSKALLLQRIHNGGQSMPPFPQLTPPEVQALVAYLDLLVGIPGAEKKQVTLELPVVHIGEDIVKGTCHICHAADGPNVTPDEMMRGAIPPLSVLTKRLDVTEFVQKVTVGRPIVMGNLDLQYRGRMPVFYYLKPEEVEAAYLYLQRYVPGQASQGPDGPQATPANELGGARAHAR